MFSSNPLLQQSPTSMTRTINPFGQAQSSFGYGMSGLSPRNAQASQQSEFGRLQGLQGLETGSIQQQIMGTQAQSAASDFRSKQMMEDARRRLFQESDPDSVRRRENLVRGGGFASQTYVDPFYLDRARREKEMEEMEMQKARFENQFYTGGGFQSWSTPVFPMR